MDWHEQSGHLILYFIVKDRASRFYRSLVCLFVCFLTYFKTINIEVRTHDEHKYTLKFCVSACGHTEKFVVPPPIHGWHLAIASAMEGCQE